MNSKKLEKFVQKIADVKSAKKYAELMNQLSTLRCYIDDIEHRRSKDYEMLTEYFGNSVMEEPEDVVDTIEFLLTLELAKNNDIFQTYKLRYALKLLNDYVAISTKNDRFVFGILFKEDHDIFSLFKSMKMLKGITIN